MTMHDKAEIGEILNLYGLALDAHRWDLFDRVFTEDVVAEFGPAGQLGGAWPSSNDRSRSSIRHWTATNTP